MNIKIEKIITKTLINYTILSAIFREPFTMMTNEKYRKCLKFYSDEFYSFSSTAAFYYNSYYTS